MKTKYLKGITALGFAAALLFSSCLKDARQFQPESVQSNLAELPLSGLAHFNADAVTGSGLDTVIFAVGVTAANPPTTSTSITLGVDNSLIDPYNTANPGLVYHPLPAGSYKLVATTVVVPAGKNSTLTSIIIDKNQLDPSLSYMVPVKIVSASGLPISANFSVHYFHIIGNDFAGQYQWEYKRFNASDTLGTPLLDVFGTTMISPVSPTEFTMETGYNGNHVRYDVTYVRNVSGSTVTYSNWNVTFVPADVSGIWGPLGITVVVPPKFIVLDPVKKTFRLNYTANNGTADRCIIDMYFK
jgi:hypothetical protein